MKIKLVGGLLLLLALELSALWLTGCGNSEVAQPQKKAPLVAVETVQKGVLARTLELTGTVDPYRVARLASPAEGPVLNLQVREGDTVKAGQTLLTIGRMTGVDALIASLREELKKEEDNLKRIKQLVEKDALPGEQLDSARSVVEKVKAQLVKAEETALDYSIAAPWDGIVFKLLVRDGNFVAPRTVLVELYDPASLIISAAVPEKYATGLRKDMTAAITLDAYLNKPFSGQIAQLYPSLDNRTRTRNIEIKLKEKVDLLPGMFARCRLTLESIPDAVTVPVQAVIVNPAGASIAFVVVEGKAVQRKVQAGIEESGRVQILAGLKPGEQVIISGQEKLKDGVEVRLPASTPDGKSKDKPGESPPAGGTPNVPKEGK